MRICYGEAPSKPFEKISSTTTGLVLKGANVRCRAGDAHIAFTALIVL
jgi:hypothetical protein